MEYKAKRVLAGASAKRLSFRESFTNSSLYYRVYRHSYKENRQKKNPV